RWGRPDFRPAASRVYGPPSTAFWLQTDSGSLYIFCLLTAQIARGVLPHPQTGWCASRAGEFCIYTTESYLLTIYTDLKRDNSFTDFELNSSLLRALA